MRVDGRAPVPRIVLGAGEGARGLASLDPVAHQGGHSMGIVTEGAGLHDRVLRQHVEVGDRREDPVDPDRAGLLRRHRPGPADHRRVVQRRERERRRELGEPVHLLPRAALQIGREQQGPLGPAQEIGGEAAHAFRGATEDDEPADAELEGVGDGAGLVAERRSRPRAQRREDQPAGIGGSACRHAGVTAPSTREPAAPVAAGTLPGWPCSVR